MAQTRFCQTYSLSRLTKLVLECLAGRRLWWCRVVVILSAQSRVSHEIHLFLVEIKKKKNKKLSLAVSRALQLDWPMTPGKWPSRLQSDQIMDHNKRFRSDCGLNIQDYKHDQHHTRCSGTIILILLICSLILGLARLHTKLWLTNVWRSFRLKVQPQVRLWDDLFTHLILRPSLSLRLLGNLHSYRPAHRRHPHLPHPHPGLLSLLCSYLL